MKITTNNTERFVAIDKAIGGYVAGITFVLIGVLICSAGQAKLIQGLLAIILGIVVILLVKSCTIVIDRTNKKLTYTSKSLVSRSSQSFGFEDIAKVQLEYSIQVHDKYSSNGNASSRPQINSTLMLVLTNGSTVRLIFRVKRVKFFQKASTVSEPNTQLGQQLAEIIGVPFEEMKQPDF